MTSHTNKIRKMAEWDESLVPIFTWAGVINRLRTAPYAFKLGARYQHSKLSPIIDTLLKIVEMQGRALKFYGNEDNWNGTFFEPAKSDLSKTQYGKSGGRQSRTTQTEVAKLLDEIGE